MKLALVDGQRKEAQPKLSGQCQACGRPMVAKCGERRMWHWSHQARSACDPWWESETEWHRNWKGSFPEEWQEIIHFDQQSGEKHIADIKTTQGWVLEFQHSYIRPEERRSRDAFYSKLVWVVNGTRRKRDRTQLGKAWNEGTPINQFTRRISSDGCALIREWAGSQAPIFFDFGNDGLLWLLANPVGNRTYVAVYPRAEFIKSHRNENEENAGQFEKLASDLGEVVRLLESPASRPSKLTPQPLPDFERYLAAQNRRRRRL